MGVNLFQYKTLIRLAMIDFRFQFSVSHKTLNAMTDDS